MRSRARCTSSGVPAHNAQVYVAIEPFAAALASTQPVGANATPSSLWWPSLMNRRRSVLFARSGAVADQTPPVRGPAVTTHRPSALNAASLTLPACPSSTRIVLPVATFQMRAVVIEARRGEQASVGRERDRVDPGRMPGECHSRETSCRHARVCDAVSRRGREDLPSRLKATSLTTAYMLERDLARCTAEDPRDVVDAGRGEPLPVGGQRECMYGADLRELGHECTGAHVPEACHPIRAGCADDLPVRAEHDIVERHSDAIGGSGCRVSRFQRRRSPSLPTLARVPASGDIATAGGGRRACRSAVGRSMRASQTRAVPSEAAVTSVVPAGANATLSSASAWPSSIACGVPSGSE